MLSSNYKMTISKVLTIFGRFFASKKATLPLTKPGQQYVIVGCASYHSIGFVLLIEDYLEEKGGKKK